MTAASRQAAQRKLDLMQLRVGYPERGAIIRGWTSIKGPYVFNVLRANESNNGVNSRRSASPSIAASRT